MVDFDHRPGGLVDVMRRWPRRRNVELAYTALGGATVVIATEDLHRARDALSCGSSTSRSRVSHARRSSSAPARCPHASWSSCRCERIERFDPQLNAFGAVYAEQALAEAERRRGPGPLSGVPIAVKDEMDIAGEVTSRGTGAIPSGRPRTPRSCAGCARRARSWSARRRCPSSACGRSRSRSPGA